MNKNNLPVIYIPPVEPELEHQDAVSVTKSYRKECGGVIPMYEIEFQRFTEWGYSHKFVPLSSDHYEAFESKGKRFYLGFYDYNTVAAICIFDLETKSFILSTTFRANN